MINIFAAFNSAQYLQFAAILSEINPTDYKWT